MEKELRDLLKEVEGFLENADHTDDCLWWDEEVDSEVGTGPWDTAMKPGKCTCGKDELIERLKSHINETKTQQK